MPVIGIPIRYDYSKERNRSIIYIYETLRRVIQKAGGDIYIIIPIQDVDYMKTKNSDFPPLTNEEKIKINKILDYCDGLFLPGGSKFTPFDRYILDYAIKKDIPTLGVCLSMQMMSCYLEDINLVKNETDINHNQEDSEEYSHNVKIDKNSKLYSILEQEEIMVNSFHNYHAEENHIYKTVAKADDGIIEALEYPNATFNIGVQWHPEKNYDSDVNSKLIIDYFIKEASRYHRFKESNILVNNK